MKLFMKLILILFIFAVAIAACSGSGTFGVSAPLAGDSAASQKAQSAFALQQAQLQVANANAAALDETAVVKAREDAVKATAQAMQVARDQFAMTADAANLPITQTAESVLQTAQAVEAKATVDARSVLLAQQQDQVTATSQAMAEQKNAQAAEAQATVDVRAILLAQQQNQTAATAQTMQRQTNAADNLASTTQLFSALMSWIVPISAAIAFAFLLLLGARYVSGVINLDNEKHRLENQKLFLLNRLIAAPSETIIFEDPHIGFTRLQHSNTPYNANAIDLLDPIVPVTGDTPIIDIEAPPAIVILSYGDQVVAERAEVREEAARCKLAMKLVRDAINHVGVQSNRIPSAALLGWPVGAWTIAIAILRPYGVETLQGADGGVFLVGHYPTLQALYIAIGERRFDIFPPPVESVTNA